MNQFRKVIKLSECKVFVPAGAIGTIVSQISCDTAERLKPDIIACDAGSTDSGPYYLGTGSQKYTHEAVKADMEKLLVLADKLHIPIAIGSSGLCGVDKGVDDLADICNEIIREKELAPKKLVCIYTEQDPDAIAKYYEAGKVEALEGAPEINSEIISQCSHIVALAGAEPFQKALAQGADIVLCGRATDTAIIASMPLMKGCHAASAWHAAKIAECGALCTDTVADGGGVFLTIDDTGFTVEPTNPAAHCTPTTVSAHMLYENANPFVLHEPGVLVDVSGSTYTALDDRRVRVEGSTIQSAPYTMKLEGSRLMGYQAVLMVGIRDRRICANPAPWLKKMEMFFHMKAKEYGLDDRMFTFELRPYGWNGVTGQPNPNPAQEILLMAIITAKSQALATKIAKLANPLLLHFPVEQGEPMPSFGFPFSPAHMERGAVYSFTLHHIVHLDDPFEITRFREVTLNG